MNKSERRSIIALPIIVLIAAGFAWAGSQDGYAVFGIPIFALCIALAFIIQWVAFIPAFVKQTEKFYDLVGQFACSAAV